MFRGSGGTSDIGFLISDSCALSLISENRTKKTKTELDWILEKTFVRFTANNKGKKCFFSRTLFCSPRIVRLLPPFVLISGSASRAQGGSLFILSNCHQTAHVSHESLQEERRRRIYCTTKCCNAMRPLPFSSCLWNNSKMESPLTPMSRNSC